MRLSKEQFCNYVNLYKQMLQEEDLIANVLGAQVEWTPGTWINNFYKLLSDMCELDSDSLIGTKLDWFCYETNFGQDDTMNTVIILDSNGVKPIKVNSPEILYDLITERGI